jgi:hypothetical protein
VLAQRLRTNSKAVVAGSGEGRNVGSHTSIVIEWLATASGNRLPGLLFAL